MLGVTASSPVEGEFGIEALRKSYYFFSSFLRSTESENLTEEHAPTPLSGQALETNSVSSEFYSNISFLNLDVDI